MADNFVESPAFEGGKVVERGRRRRLRRELMTIDSNDAVIESATRLLVDTGGDDDNARAIQVINANNAGFHVPLPFYCPARQWKLAAMTTATKGTMASDATCEASRPQIPAPTP